MNYPELDPVAFGLDAFTLFGQTIGPISVHWYGITYLCAFVSAWALGYYRSTRPWSPLKKGQIEDLIFYGAMGVVLGGRIGYIIFYNFGDFLDNPLILLKVWEGGMAFHGGLIGVMVAMLLYAKKTGVKFVDIMDFVAPLVPLGLGFGRLGNVINGELWGRETSVSWGMIYPKDVDALIRHPSNMYQAFLEGVVLFAVMLWFSRKQRPRAAVGAMFLVGYGAIRFGVEFVREPDAHISYMFGWMTRGQFLSLPMMIGGLLAIYLAYKIAEPETSGASSSSVSGKSQVKTKKQKSGK